MSLRVRTYRTDARAPRVAAAHPAPPYRPRPHPPEAEEGERPPEQIAERLRPEG